MDITTKNSTTYLLKRVTLLILLIGLSSCEEVIEVDLDSEEPRLIVDALIRVDTSQEYTDAAIRVSLSTSFFDEIQPAVLDEMSIQNSETGVSIPYEAVPGEPGLYRPLNTATPSVVNNRILTTELLNTSTQYLLSIRYQEEQFVARTSFTPTSDIDFVVQGEGGLFNEEDTEVMIAFTDAPDRKDFYVFDFGFGEFITSEDEFFEGQQFSFSYFYDASLEPGDEASISILGAEETFFDFMNGLLDQSQQGANGPFQTPAATIRGNIFKVEDINDIENANNIENPNDFALGYFAIAQEFKTSLTIE